MINTMNTMPGHPLPDTLPVNLIPKWAEWDDVFLLGFTLLLLLTKAIRDLFFSPKDPYYHLWFESPQGTQSIPKKEQERDVANVILNQKKDVVIFYGSQSGTAEQLSKSLAREIDKQFSKATLVADFSDYDCCSIACIPRNIVVLFILSTYGEGDPPDNSIKFDEWLSSLSGDGAFSMLQFAVLGLGNSNYKFFNRVGITAFERLKAHGAIPLLQLHSADDGKGLTQEGFSFWKEMLFQVFIDKLYYEPRQRAYEPTTTVTFDDSLSIPGDKPTHDTSLKANMQDSAVYQVPIQDMRILTPDKNRIVLHVDVDISQHARLKYQAGDHLAIWPENSAAEVECLNEALGISHVKMHQPAIITSTDPDLKFLWPQPITMYALFKRHLNISGLVSRELILGLKQFASTTAIQDILDAMSHNQEVYAMKCASDRLTIASVLRLASSSAWQIPLSFILENIPPLKPRYYSIASAASVHPRMVSMTVSIKRLELGEHDFIYGLASQYLLENHRRFQHCITEKSDDRPHIWCHLRRSKFKPPVSARQPMILVASGSGMAPFRGFVQHRMRQAQVKGDIGEMILFFGCRDETEHLYQDEIEEFRKLLPEQVKVVSAYSRRGGGYVQDCLQQHQDEVIRLLRGQKASLYICGSVKMSRGVREKLKEIICSHEGLSEAEFDGWETGQMKTKKWQFDVWG